MIINLNRFICIVSFQAVCRCKEDLISYVFANSIIILIENSFQNIRIKTHTIHEFSSRCRYLKTLRDAKHKTRSPFNVILLFYLFDLILFLEIIFFFLVFIWRRPHQFIIWNWFSFFVSLYSISFLIALTESTSLVCTHFSIWYEKSIHKIHIQKIELSAYIHI